MLVLGISDLEHDTAAAVLGAGGVLAAVEEDKLSRSSTSTAGVPQRAMECCLTQAGARPDDLVLAGIASRPKRAWLRDEGGRLSAFVSRAGATPFPVDAQDGLFWKLNQVQALRRRLGRSVPLLNFEHHTCHAASAFFPSAFERALILTLDQCGDMWAGTVAIGEGDGLRLLQPLHFPNSLGWFYSKVTELLGFRPGRDEHKVQWLSREGEPEFVPVFRKLFTPDRLGLPTLNLQYVSNPDAAGSAFSPEILCQLGVDGSASLRGRPLGARIARSAQEFLQETVIELAETWRQRTGAKYLCVAGGVFLNVLLVRALEQKTGFSKVFAQPVAGNAGTALGAAYLAQRRHGEGFRREELSHLYLGPQFEEGDIKAVLDNCKTIYRYLPSEKQLLDETTQLLQRDEIVAWCQGRLEFGHRALGNRSILGSPFSPYVMENLNKYVKHREDFHPFALAVPAESAMQLFETTENCRFMCSIGTLRDSAPELTRFTFHGGAVRVQTVERSVNPRFWALLKRFGEVAPAPVLINTSFNLFGEPLVCDPREAIRSFYCSGIDALAIGNFLVVKP
jgi:carbamoyltransferase